MLLYQVGGQSQLGEARYRLWRRSMRHTAALFVATVVLCAAGLYLLDTPGHTREARLLDALWNAANTISTLGSLSTLNNPQRAFMIVAMLTLVGTAGYALTVMAGNLSNAEVRVYRENRRMQKIISGLSGHTILAGFGPVGRIVAEKLATAGKTVVVVDRDSDVASEASNLGYLTVQGSIGEDEVLQQVHTEHAHAMVVTIPDPDRVLACVLMARMLNAKLQIYGVSDSGKPWLLHAGATDVIFGDQVIAQEILKRLGAAPGDS